MRRIPCGSFNECSSKNIDFFIFSNKICPFFVKIKSFAFFVDGCSKSSKISIRTNERTRREGDLGFQQAQRVHIRASSRPFLTVYGVWCAVSYLLSHNTYRTNDRQIDR